MKKAVILARVSTKRQEEEGLSLQDIQLPALRQYAKDNGFTVDPSDEFVFQESADKKIRKKFNEMVSYVKKNNSINAIIGYRVDRITRNYRDAVAMDDLRLECDKELHFVHDRLVIDRKSAGRDITDWDTKVYLAKQFLNRLKEDAYNTIKTKLSNGELPGQAPFGYANFTLENNKKWVKPDEHEALIVKQVFEWYASENYSLLEISRKLKKEHQVSKSKSMVHFILNNRFYIGFMTSDGKEYPHRYDLFINKKLFDKSKAVMAKRSGAKQRFKYAGKSFAYRGLIKCHECGCSITPDRKKRKLKDGTYNYHTYYFCTNYHKVHDKTKYINEATIDEQFTELFENLKIPEDKLAEITASLKESHQDKNHFLDLEIDHLHKELKRYQNRIRVAYDDRLDACITKDAYEEIRENSEQKQQEIKDELETLDVADKEYYLTTSYLLAIGSRSADIFSRSKPMEKRALLNFVLSNQTLDGEKVRYEVKYPFNKVLEYAPRSAWLPG